MGYDFLEFFFTSNYKIPSWRPFWMPSIHRHEVSSDPLVTTLPLQYEKVREFDWVKCEKKTGFKYESWKKSSKSEKDR